MTWTAPAGGVDGGGYLVVRGTTDPSTSPNANGIYAVNNTVTSGQTVVYIGTATTFTDTGLTNGTTYYYRIYTVDKAFNYSAAAAVSAAPAAPTPSITGANTATAFTTIYGTASANQTFSVSGVNLTANLVATAPTGFEVSSDGTTYGSTATFTQSSGSASGTLRIRLSATAVPGGTYNSQNIALTSTGATTVNIATAASGNTVSQKALTITGLTGANKAYDGLTTATTTGTAAVSGLVGSDTVTLGGTPSYNFSSAAVGAAKSITTTGYTITGGQSSYYTLTQPTGLTANITTRSLTITANAESKTYGNAVSSGSGKTAFTSNGLQNSETIDSVTLTYAGGYNATDSAGTYTITPSAATGSTFTASNYNLSYVNGNLTVTAIVPAAPTGISITPSNGQLSVAFTAGSDGGSAITNYQYSTDGGTSWRNRASGTTATPLVITTLSTDGTTALTNGTSYSVQIRAVNAIGNGTATTSTSATPATSPAAPTGISITPSNGQLSVAFTAGSDGGSAITNYQYSTDGGTSWRNRASGTTATPLVITTLSTDGTTALTNGTSYSVQIRAVNAIGNGTATSTTAATPLTTPTLGSPTVSSINTTSAMLGATVTANGGAGLTERGTVWGTIASPTGNASAEGNTTVSAFTHSRTGLTANTLYYYRGYATNSAGTAYTADGNFTTLPLPPTVGTGSAATTSGFTANWTHPTMGSASYTYTVEVDNDSNFGSIDATVSSISSGSTTQAITGLSSSTTYYYRVKSVNTTGSSAYSTTSAGIATSTPSGTISTSGTLSAFSATYPSASAQQSFSVNGTNLTGSLTVTAPSGFEVSLSSGSGFGATATISANGTLASTTVYVRLAASTNAASYSGNVTISGGSATTQNVAIPSSTVSKATPTVSVAPTASAITYGQTLASSTLSSGTASVNGTFAFTTNSTAPSVGTASQPVTFTPTDTTNYNTASTTASVTVNKATPTVSAAPTASGITYGQTLASSTLSGGTASVNGTFAFTNNATSPAVGTASQTVTFTPTDTANYNTASTTASVTVSKATPTVSVAPTASAITYGQTLASSTITPGTSSVPGTYAFTTPATSPSVGTASQPVTFTPTDSTNYNTASTTASVTVNKATPTVSVAPTASGITYGQTLASSTLSGGTSSVAGTFAFTTNSTAPSVGTASQPVTFTPADTANYNTASTTASVTVSQAPLTITGLSVASKTYDGTTAATLSGSAAYSGLVNSESFSVSGTPSATFGNATVGTSKAVTVTGYTAPNGNYTLTQPTGLTANITTRALTVTASDVSKASGVVLTGAAGSTAFTSNGLQNGETIGTVTIAYGDAASASGNGSTIGTYTGQVTPSAATGGTFTASNYAITYATGNITVTAAPVSLAVWNQTWSGTAASPLSANTTATGVTGSVTQVGLTGGNSSSRYSASAWNGSSTSTNYLSVTLNATSSYALNLNSSTINATWGSSNTGPASYAVYSSVNSFSAPVGTFASSNTTTVNGTITLPSSGYSNLSSIEFRVVGNATSANGASTQSAGTGGFSYLQFKGIISQNPPTVTAATINGTVGTALSANITVSNSPTGYAISSGTLPAGLSLNATTGVISGTPTTAGNGTIVAVTATNGGGTSTPANLTFNIAAIAPTIGTPSVSSINTTSATLGATVTANGGETLSARGTAWGTSASPTGNSLAEGNTTVSAFTHSRTGLTANTLYYYRGYATNSAGTAYTADGNFTTLPLPPTVGTGSAVSASGFTANWSHPTMGAASYTYTLDFSTDNTFATGVTTVTGISSASTSSAINALNASTTYYYRVKAVNAQGSSAWSATSAGVSTSAALGAISTSGTLSAFTSTYPAASAEQSFSVSGSNLSGSLTVTAPAGFEVSLTSGSGFGSTATISASGTLASTTVYVRLPASATPGSYSGNVAVSGGDAATQNIAASGTVSQASQTITFGALATKNATDAAFALTGTASSNLTVSYTSSNTSVATVAGNTVTIAGGGSTTITASQAGNTNYAAATSVPQTLTVNKVAQTISGVNSTATKTYGDAAYSLGASVGSGLTINYTTSNASVATIAANGTVTIVAPGTTTLTASQAGDSRYSAAADATQALTVSKATPTLTFNSSNSTTVNGTVTLNATSASTGGVTYTSSNNAVVSINGTVATGAGAGTAIITASQAADSNYNAATANQTMTVAVAPVVILSEDFATNSAGDNTTTSGSSTAWTTTANFTTGATVYKAGGAVRLGSGSGNGSITSKTIDLSQGGGNFTVAFKVKGWTTVEGNITVSVTGLTSQTVAYTATMSAASFESKTLNFTGGTASSTITLATTAGRAFLDDISVYYVPQAPTVTAATINGTVGTALSANITATNSPTSYAISSGTLPSGLSLNGTTGRISGTPTAAGNGTVVAVTATSAGGTSAAANLTFNIAQGSQTITFGALSAKTYGDSTFSLTAAASSNLSVSYASSNTSVATVAGSTVTVVGVGSTTITASQAGDSNYTAATNVTQTLTVGTKSLTGTFTANDKTYDGSTSATVASRAVTGKVGADDVTHTGGTATFANATTGNGKTVTLAGATLTGAAASNYSLGSVSTTTANITQATPTISVAPTASNITIGQTLANSTLSGGNASVAGAFAFTTPATAPALGISSQGVTFTPTDSTNYTAQTTSANVGVLCLAPVLNRATAPVAGGFTVNWNAATGAANYTVLHSASKNMTVATSVNTASTSLAITGLSNGLRYVQVRANNAAGASANSTQQVNQLQSIAAGATSYMSAPGEVGTNTVAGIFGSANEAGLASGATDSASTTILLLNQNGATANTIFYNSSVNQWREGATAMDTTSIAQGKAFMLKNNTGSTDYFLLVGTPREGGSQPTVSLNSAGNYTLCTTGRTTPTTIANMNLNPGTSAGQFKAATKAKDADKVIVVDQTTGAATNYYHNGTTWMDGLRAVPSAEIPAGQGFFIKKASNSTFSSWTLPAE